MKSSPTRWRARICGTGVGAEREDTPRASLTIPSLFPASQAHETNLVKELYGIRPIPEGFNLADEMIKRLRAGQLESQAPAELRLV